MKIGIFDSGLGGLIIARSILNKLPKYNFVYLGDTKNLPYGEKRLEQIYKLTKKAVNFLFKQNCQIIIIACNTSSALALRKIQKEFLPSFYPNRRVLGVIIPTLEIASKRKNIQTKIGVIGTKATIHSHIYKKELSKINFKAKIIEQSISELASLIESNDFKNALKILKLPIAKFKENKINSLILGCTHYSILKNEFKKLMGNNVKIISQDEIIPNKLDLYLKKHKEIKQVLTKGSSREYYITSISQKFFKVAQRLFGKKIDFKLVKV